MTKLKACSSTPNFSFKLTQVSACMVSAALLTIVPMQYALAQELSSAQIAKSNLTGNIDGSLRAGFIVTDDSNFDGSAAITVGNTSSQSLVHNFNTVGGSGSGGGAGLGGAFFVDTGATLTIINTDFKSNRVQGGAGGSAPALLFYDKNLIVTGSSVDLPSYFVNAEVAGGATPLLQYNNGKYSFNYLSVSRDIATLIKKDSVAIFDDYDVTTKISNIGSDVVSFAKPIEASATNVPKFVENVSSGFMSTANGAVIVNYKLTPDTGENEGKNKTVEIPDLSSVTVGQKVVASTNGRTSLQVATVVSVEYFTKEDDDTKNANGTLQGKVKSINLDKTISGSVEYIDVIKAPTFKATQFATDASGKVVTVTSTLGSFTSGMTVSWVEGSETKTAKVLSVGGPNNRTLTLDSAIASNVTDIKAVENPLTGDNTINIPNAATKFSIGQSIYVPGKEGVAFEGSVLSISGSEVTVTPKLQNAKLADHYDPALGLALKTSAASVSQVDRTLVTVSYNTNGKSEASIKAQLVGHLIDGASFPDDTVIQDVRVSNGSVTLVLSKPVNDGSVDFFKVYSPLKMGGSMNNVAVPLVASIQPRSDGTDGNSANSVSTFFNDGEGVDGTNGAAAGDNKGGQGFNGGDGGSGSNGANVNPWLIYDVAAAAASMKSAATDLSAATADMVEASAPDPVVGAAVELPDPLKIATATINLTKANIDMGFAVADTILAAANMGYWADQLREGLAGLGGAGGDGGEASDGGKFFGGGAGGAGGAGGDGAYEISDGGSGGGGGQGGAGGFGAGGGAGGAGGTKGENGNAVDGDPGDGGFAGFGAGDGTDGKGRFGGGGDGLGGSIFVRSGGGLLINGNALFERNYVAGGSTTSQFGEAGGAAGTDMFIMKGSNIRLAPGLGKVIQFDGTIADDSLATDGGFQNAAGDGADIRIGGQGNGGLVIFNGENTYSGNTILEGATLTALVGVGVNDASLIRFNGAGVIAPDLIGNKVVSSMSLDTVGTFLLQEDYVRRAGLDPSETAWTGSGGFASSLADGVTVNLGALDDNGRGQDLTWGQDGFFAPFDNGSGYSGALTFGSDLSQGAVRFTNNVDLNNKTASIAVYNNGNLNTSTATLSGNWGNSTGNKGILVVGDSGAGSPYNGNLFMTGQNSLDSLVVAGGVLSTYNADGSAGRLMKPTGDLFVLADKDVEGVESHLDLFSDESVRNVHVMKGGVLTLTQTLVASDVVQNEGLIAILGENVTSLPDAASVALKPIYLPLNNGGFTAWEGGLVVKKTMINSGVVTQAANAELGNLINLGIWNGFGNVATTEGSLDNSKNAKFMVVGESSVAVDLNNSGSINLTGDLGVGRNLINRENAVFSIAGNTTVENAVYNYGAIEQKGNMNVEASVQNNGYWRFGQDATINALSLLGSGVFCLSDTTAANCSGGNAKKLSLSLSASTTFNGVFTGNGGFEKLGASKLQLTEAQQFTGDLLINGGTLEMAARATLNDSVHVVVGSEGSFIVGVEDTIRKVTNNGKNSVVLNADLTVTNGFVNNGRLIADAGLNNNRVLQLQESGLTGSSDGQLQITEGTTFVLAQNGNTSYEGQIQSLGNRDTSSLLKSGTGTLTLNNSVDVKNILIGQGELALNKEGILKQDAIVTIGGNGKLSLVTGDQSIDKLLGEGVVNIGSNDLMIANGGAFKGEILGSGQVAVDKGTFKVSGAIVSSNADFAVRDGSTTVLGKNGVLSVDRLNVQSGGVLALGEDTSDQGGRVTTNTFDVHGVLKGSGFIEGAATIHSGGQLKPGYSPGRLYFGNDLNLATGSNVEMEIQNPTENPGTGFDQVVIGGSFNIQGGAKLKVAGLGNSSPNLSMGQSVNIFSFQPGKGYGVFGEVTAENMGNSIALNLATGNVVGFGSKVLGDVASTAKSSNEQSIYTGLLQKNTGGVAQFYGGHFIERLTAAFDNEQNTKSVYNSYNPESYLALSDIAQAAAQDALPVWKFQHANQDRLFAYATNTTRANGQHADHQSVGLGIRAYTVGASQKIGENTLLATFGGVKSNVQSKYVNSTGNGVTVGLSLQGAVNTLPESIWFAGLSHANLDSKGTRLGTYRFQDVNSSATQVQAGLESKFSFEHLYLMTRGAFALGSSNRGRVDESSSSPLNTMSVYAARHHYKLLDLALEVGQQINTQTSWYGSANFQVGDLNNNRITAGFDNDQAQFTVTGKSAMGSNTRLMAGVRHQYSPAMSVDFSLGWARGWDRSTDIQARFGLSKSF